MNQVPFFRNVTQPPKIFGTRDSRVLWPVLIQLNSRGSGCSSAVRALAYWSLNLNGSNSAQCSAFSVFILSMCPKNRSLLEIFFYSHTMHLHQFATSWHGQESFFCLHGYARSHNLSCLDPFYSYLLIPKENKIIWSELESNPGPLVEQATALTTRPWLLGQVPLGDAALLFLPKNLCCHAEKFEANQAYKALIGF